MAENKKAIYNSISSKTDSDGNLYVTATDFTNLELSIGDVGNKYFTKEMPDQKTPKREERKNMYHCDWCGTNFEATKKEVDPEKNGGYFCKPKCKIEAKYGRSALEPELFAEEINQKGDN